MEFNRSVQYCVLLNLTIVTPTNNKNIEENLWLTHIERGTRHATLGNSDRPKEGETHTHTHTYTNANI